MRSQRATRRPGRGLPISLWLVLGFVFVIGAFATTSILALRGTREAMAAVARTQQRFEPLARSVRDLGEGTAGFDHAVLTFLRTDSATNRTAVAQSAARLSQAANRAAETARTTAADGLGPLIAGLGAHQAEGFRLLDLQDQRGRAISGLAQTYADLDRRVLAAGGAGLVIGENVLARPSLVELIRSLEGARAKAMSTLTQDAPGSLATNEEEAALQRTLELHREEFARSPARATSFR